jgi:site-specific DNA-methyltransferase (adenine-specific)
MTDPYYSDEFVTLWHGDCLDVLPTLPDASVDSVVTDPPYELGFMGKGWDASGIAYNVTVWRECLRVLKPGGHMLAFGGTRTWHRLACAVEDAGFEMRDSIAWLYGSGFPKSLDVSKAIDKAAGAEREVVGKAQWSNSANHFVPGEDHTERVHLDITAPATPDAERWQGWGTALKPAFEPVVVARKPLAGTVAANVLAWGTGALNIDATRVTAAAGDYDHPGNDNRTPRKEIFGADARSGKQVEPHTAGRWPANVLLGHTPDCDVIYEGRGEIRLEGPCAPGCPVAELDRQSGECVGMARGTLRRGATTGLAMGANGIYGEMAPQTIEAGYGDTGGASRFFPTFRYVAKAPASERPRANGIAHPTVKPLDLMRWLVRLVTPPGGTVLEPFAGSGTTAEACVLEGFQCIAIEREADYLPLIVSRLDKPVQLGLDFEEPAS